MNHDQRSEIVAISRKLQDLHYALGQFNSRQRFLLHESNQLHIRIEELQTRIHALDNERQALINPPGS